ncbi:MAG: ATP-binding cassette domain-containing protein [Deltaproteobacteria bacterium]|nr:MAG: ATP-binding cassette domain-containing protein [Deltaproteobacteria bacterium]
MLYCQNLNKTYGRHPALRDVNLSLEAGRAVGLLGPNGAGKSTLIKCLLGLIRPESGRIESEDEMRIGYLPELARLPEHASALALIRLGLALNRQDMAEATSWLSKVGIPERLWERPVCRLSKGLRQRVAIAHALAGKPELIVLDEPMSGLDALGRTEALAWLREAVDEGAGMLVCSHIVPDLVRLCDEIHLLVNGRIEASTEISDHSIDEIRHLEALLQRHASQAREGVG